MSDEKATELLDVLDLERIERNLYRGQNESRQGRLFGGQVLAQALAAADKTVREESEPLRPCHSLHGYFLRPGRHDLPVLYKVERIRDGRSFSTRRIVAIQNGEAIFSMDASFQLEEAGLHHQDEMPAYPDPDELEDDLDVAQRRGETKVASGWSLRSRPFEHRSVYPIGEEVRDDFRNPIWIRFRKQLPDNPSLHQYLLAYASDMGFVSTSMLPHRESVGRDRIQMASLDHALWFHQSFKADDWILYIKETTTAAHARGYNRGLFFDREGKLIASALQEGLMRVRE